MKRHLSTTTSSLISRNNSSLPSLMMLAQTMTHHSSKILCLKFKTRQHPLICNRSRTSSLLKLSRTRTRLSSSNHSNSRSSHSSNNISLNSNNPLPFCSKLCLLRTTSPNTTRLILMCTKPHLRTTLLSSPLDLSSSSPCRVHSKVSSRWDKACSVALRASLIRSNN